VASRKVSLTDGEVEAILYIKAQLEAEVATLKRGEVLLTNPREHLKNVKSIVRKVGSADARAERKRSTARVDVLEYDEACADILGARYARTPPHSSPFFAAGNRLTKLAWTVEEVERLARWVRRQQWIKGQKTLLDILNESWKTKADSEEDRPTGGMPLLED
jgi:hypothetical protein